MKIQYIGNTCDIDGIDAFGEICVLLKDGKPVSHHDYSDGSLEFDYFTSVLEPFGVDLEFESIKPDKKLIKLINEYLVEYYGEPYNPDAEDED